jgi:hypothetical protein
MQDKEELQNKTKKLLPVDGNCYSTRYGVFDCEVREEPDGKPESGGVKLEVRLTRRVTRKKPTPTVRRLLIYATRQAVEVNRLSLVIEVHNWVLSEPRTSEYLEKEVWL